MKIFIHVLLLALLVLATKAVDDSACAGELSNLLACQVDLPNPVACFTCYDSALGEEDPESCQDGEDQFCQAFEPCKDSCGNCVDEVYAVVGCAGDEYFGASCNIDCQGGTGGVAGVTDGTGGTRSTGSAAPAGHLVMPLFSVMGAMVALTFIG